MEKRRKERKVVMFELRQHEEQSRGGHMVGSGVLDED